MLNFRAFAYAGLLALAAAIPAIGQTSFVKTISMSLPEQDVQPSATAVLDVGLWRLSRLGLVTDCLVKRDASRDGLIFPIEDRGDCKRVHKQIANVASLEEDSLGNLVILDRHRNRLFEFTAAEFEGYESVYPEYPLLTLEAAE